MPRSWAPPQTVCLQGLCPSPLYNATSQIFNKNYLLALSSQLKEASNNSPFYKPCSSLILTGPCYPLSYFSTNMRFYYIFKWIHSIILLGLKSSLSGFICMILIIIDKLIYKDHT